MLKLMHGKGKDTTMPGGGGDIPLREEERGGIKPVARAHMHALHLHAYMKNRLRQLTFPCNSFP